LSLDGTAFIKCYVTSNFSFLLWSELESRSDSHPLAMYDSKGNGSTALKRLMTEYRGTAKGPLNAFEFEFYPLHSPHLVSHCLGRADAECPRRDYGR
jgi:hypothetical protein